MTRTFLETALTFPAKYVRRAPTKSMAIIHSGLNMRLVSNIYAPPMDLRSSCAAGARTLKNA